MKRFYYNKRVFFCYIVVSCFMLIKMNFKTYLIISFFVSICLFSLTLFSQKTGFINTELIRDRYPDAKLAEQRCQSVIDE